MHITLAVIGKLKDKELKSLYEEYKKRLEWKLNLQEFEGKDASSLLLNALPSSSYIIALDEKGENFKSEEFSHLLNEIQLHHQGKVTFIIGGADGLSKDITNKAHKFLSFGRMTWPHLLVRVMLMEQLYRAQQILKGHPYHRGH
ncbi:MAG: 23S rRNA (pseudouridine(1915)-N(3))-methyltransferase RlmH [Proteobacteria bacterium]|nr:23S rRNA (pseudouridine(1915)-N(3))-methyltransferase RlmH [Pseudomonadota bacterium]